MGISSAIRRAAAPVGSAVNAKFEALFRHITNEARDTRASLSGEMTSLSGEMRSLVAGMDGLRRDTQGVHDRLYEVVDPAMTTIAEASTLLQHVALRVERRLTDLSVARAGAELADLASTRAAVEVPFALAALGRSPTGTEVVMVGELALLALLTASAGHPTTLVGASAGAGSPQVRTVTAEAGWAGPPVPVALVVRSVASPPTAADIDHVVAAAAWVAPEGRLVILAPVGEAPATPQRGGRPPLPQGGITEALGAFGRAGWSVTHQAVATTVGGAWGVTGTASPTEAGALVLVELARTDAG